MVGRMVVVVVVTASDEIRLNGLVGAGIAGRELGDRRCWV